ncbi:MAG: hypothetical protein V1678_00725 [Candidatus Aenigmatarchaeota archaeon]
MSKVNGEVYGTTEKQTLSGEILEALSPLNILFGGYFKTEKKPHILVRTDDGKTESFLKENHDYPTGTKVTVEYSPRKNAY